MISDKYNFEGKVAIVVGGGTGIGKQVSLLLARMGANIVIAARRQDLIEQTSQEVKKLGRRSMAIPTDAADSGQVQRMVDRTIAEFHRIDILVNCAGIARGVDPGALPLLGGGRLKEIWEWTDADWSTGMDINLTTAFYCCRAVARHMIEQASGSIINFSSGAGMRGMRGSFTYCSAKAGIIGLTKCLSVTWARHGIRVNCIAPGVASGEQTRSMYSEELLKKRASFIPVGRVGEPREVANVALFLASEASGYITGEVFICDGAAMAGGYAPAGYAPNIPLPPDV